MGISLFGLTPAATYPSLIKFGDNSAISGTLRALSDGLGTDLPIQVSTAGVNFTGTASIGGTALSPSSGVSGAIQFSNGSAFASDATNFFWDDTNNRLGVGTNTPTSRLQVKGDGTNPIARFESSAGTYLALINNTQQIYNVTNGGQFNIRPDEGTTNNPGIDFVPGIFGSTTFIRYAGLRYVIGHNSGNNNNAGMLLQMANNLDSINNARFNFNVNNTSIITTSGTSSGINYNDTFASAAGSANYRPLSLAYTINNTGAQTGNTTGIFLNATETALNGQTHNLLDLQKNGTSQVRVTNAGIIFCNNIISNGYISIASASSINFSGASQIFNVSDGIIRLTDNANTSFNRLQLGGTTSSFPSIKRNGTAIDFRLADDSGYCSITASSIFANGNIVEGSTAGRFDIRGQYDMSFQAGRTGGVGGFSFGNLNAAPAASAIVDITSTTKGFLPPRMTTTERNAITSPAAGLSVYNTTLGTTDTYDGATWQRFGQQTLIKGSGSTSATTSLLVQNSAGSSALQVLDDSRVVLGSSSDFAVYSGSGITTRYAMSVGTTSLPVASAVLDVVSTTKGFLPPRMTTTQRTAITGTAGLMVYDTTVNKLFVHNGVGWEQIQSI
jgi:hypothetical protein